LKDFVSVLTQKEISAYPIHLKLDTGMHRLGFSIDDTEVLINYLTETSTVRVQSVFSHMAAAGAPAHDAFTEAQMAIFEEFSKQLTAALGYPVIRHIANTAGIQRWPEAHLDMVRLGIGLYGIGNDSGQILSLQPASSLKSTVIQTRKVAAGESVGYGRRGRLSRDSVIATVSIGYADGYDRRFGNGVGQMIVRDTTVHTVVDICIDMTMLDVTGLEVKEGDEVAACGNVEKLATCTGTSAHE